MDYKSKTLQALAAKRAQNAQQGGYTAAEFAKMKLELEQIKRKVEELTGERGENPAVRTKTFKDTFSKLMTDGRPFGGVLRGILVR